MSRIKLAGALALAVLFAGPASAQSGGSGGGVAPGASSKWGSIYYSQSTRAYGYSFQHGGQAAAEAAAYKNCSGRAADCKKAVSFENGCGALAVSPKGGWGSGHGPTRERAEYYAMGVCQKNSSSQCSVIRWQCSQ